MSKDESTQKAERPSRRRGRFFASHSIDYYARFTSEEDVLAQTALREEAMPELRETMKLYGVKFKEPEPGAEAEQDARTTAPLAPPAQPEEEDNE
jgi:hypothetical protein